MTPAGAILAGGAARRMGGRDKAALMLAGRPLVAHVAARLAPQVGALAVTVRAGAGAPDGVTAIRDSLPGAGPLAGILAAMDWAADLGLEAVATAPVDAPFLPADLVARLTAAGAPAMAARGGVLHPVFGLWPVALRGDLRTALGLGQRKVRDWAAGYGTRVVDWPETGPDPFLNLNRPEDLEAAEARLA